MWFYTGEAFQWRVARVSLLRPGVGSALPHADPRLYRQVRTGADIKWNRGFRAPVYLATGSSARGKEEACPLRGHKRGEA